MKGKLNKAKGRSWFYFCMCAMAAVFLCAVFMTAAADGITTKDEKAKEAVDKAIKALGGEEKINGIKSLIVKGTVLATASNPGNDSVRTPNDYEILILFPDNIIRISRQPKKKNIISFDGVSNGKTILQPLDARMYANTAIAEEIFEAAYPSELKKQLRLACGMIMKSISVPVTISSGSKRGVFEMLVQTGHKYYDSLTDEIEFDSKGYPSVIRYIDLIYPGGPEIKTEQRFSKRFSVDGIMFPRNIITTNSYARTEIRIKEVQINPTLSLKDFDIPR